MILTAETASRRAVWLKVVLLIAEHNLPEPTEMALRTTSVDGHWRVRLAFETEDAVYRFAEFLGVKNEIARPDRSAVYLFATAHGLRWELDGPMPQRVAEPTPDEMEQAADVVDVIRTVSPS